MFSKILIANRGEIACRVIKTAKKMGIRSVAVYSDADQNARHVTLADEAIHIGASPSSESYLVGERIIDAAQKTGAQAIHPGYGFLSENAGFAKACADNNLVFIGPPTSAIETMGSKSAAKNIMKKANVPLVPGYHGEDQDPALLKKSADEIGYPVLLKAVAGGGGKGMRQVRSRDEFEQALNEAKRESMASFAIDDMLVEKYLMQPRHVEVQVFCDQRGNGVYLFERDCSVQRRHQKIIEEAPAPNITQQQREAMGTTAVRAAQAIDYEGAGTVEFLFDVDGSFYFMEMNTRLQVEHPVTEMITGQDLVEWQLKVACGQPLPLTQGQLLIHGHSFEARIYAEDPNNEFLPTTGTLATLRTPQENEFVRVDTGVVEGDNVSPFYDPMIAKLIVWDKDRDRARARMANALTEYQISGVTTNLNFLYDLTTCPPFIEAKLDTGFIEKHSALLFNQVNIDLPTVLPQAGLYLLLKNQLIRTSDTSTTDPWSANNAWRMNQRNIHQFEVKVGDSNHIVKVEQPNSNKSFIIHLDNPNLDNHSLKAEAILDGKQLICTLDGHRQQVMISKATANTSDDFVIFSEHGSTPFKWVHANLGEDEHSIGNTGFIAPMNGTIIEVLVDVNDAISTGQPVIIMEAMKMQHTMRAPSDGKITELYCQQGDLVDGGSELLNFEAAKE